MKRSHFLFTAFFFSLFFCDFILAQPIRDIKELDKNGNGRYDEGEVDCQAEYQCGPCVVYCPVTRFKPEYYCETKCVDEPYTVEKRCCRYVDRYYKKSHCRYVPKYYQKTCCKMEPEYYETTHCMKVPEYYTTCETKYRKKYIKEQKCCYKPCKYWKKSCEAAPSPCNPCPAAPSCAPAPCPATPVCAPCTAPSPCSPCNTRNECYPSCVFECDDPCIIKGKCAPQNSSDSSIPCRMPKNFTPRA